MKKLVIFVFAFISVALTGHILSRAQAFFLPLVMGLVLGYLIISIAEGIRRLRLFGKALPYSICYMGVISAVLYGGWAVIGMVSRNLAALVSSAPVYQEKLKALLERAYLALDIARPPPDLWELFFNQLDLVAVTSNLVRMLTEVAGYAGMITVYLLFILLEYSFFEAKLSALVRDEDKRSRTRALLSHIAKQVQSYLRIKTLISLVTAVGSYLVMTGMGLDFAEFWAFLIFLLNFVPTIGSITATVFPCLLALVQFDELMPALVVALLLTMVQLFMGSFLEPRIMGSSLNLSGLVIIMALAVWGQIWGVVGMFLCVPILVILNIVLANFPVTRPVAIILSQNGKTDFK